MPDPAEQILQVGFTSGLQELQPAGLVCCSIKKQVNDDQDECWYAQYPCEKVLAHGVLLFRRRAAAKIFFAAG